MTFWKKMNTRWDRGTIRAWSSLQRTIYILFPLLVYFLVHDMVEICLWAGLNSFMEKAGEGIRSFLRQNAYSIRGVIYGIAILAGVAVIRRAVFAEIRDGMETEESLFGTTAGEQVKKYMFLAALAFLSSLGLNLLFSLSGFTESSQTFTETAQAQFGVDFLIGLVLYGILSPVAEEAVFRGLIYNRMKRCFRYEIALVVSAMLFGLYHGNVVQAVYGTILGLLMAYMYELYQSFAAPILFHGVANVSIYVLMNYYSFANMDRNIGMVVSVVCLLGAAGCFFYIRKCIKETKNKQ